MTQVYGKTKELRYDQKDKGYGWRIEQARCARQLLVDSDTWTKNEKLFVTIFTRKNTGPGEAEEEERREQDRYFFLLQPP